jgi:hypothetical protein
VRSSRKRLVLDYRSGELVMRVLYRSSLDAPNGTKGRRRQVSELGPEEAARVEAMSAAVESRLASRRGEGGR